MPLSHYWALLAGYVTALIGWIIFARLLPASWPRCELIVFPHPWRELGYALLAAVGVIVLGQAYVRGQLLPSKATEQPVLDAVNQLLIFSPVFVLLYLRKHSLKTVWLPTDRVWPRILAGIVLALAALAVFLQVQAGSASLSTVLSRIVQPRNCSYLVQVLLEDIVVAFLFVRIAAAIGVRAAIVMTGILFAAGHIPTLLAQGVTFPELATLFLDAGLGVLMISVLQRSSDVWWFWMVHFAMDMTQFYSKGQL